VAIAAQRCQLGVHEEIYQAVEGISAGGDVQVLASAIRYSLAAPSTARSPASVRWKAITIDAFDTPNLEGLSLRAAARATLPENHRDTN
jgi:hypothetical protein